MEKVINYGDLRSFAYSNDRLCKTVSGVALDFFGLGGQEMYDSDPDIARRMAAEGVIWIVPYYDPWCWMNRAAVKYVDEIVSVLFEHYKLPEGTRIISTGGSMGGLSAIVYCAYAARTPSACVANCPVCDLPYHYTERPDLPRTLYSAFGSYGTSTLEGALKTASPLHLVSKLPDIDYYVFHCEADKAVNKEKHSDRFVAEMHKAGRRVTYIPVPGRGHCDLDEKSRALYEKCILFSALGKKL